MADLDLQAPTPRSQPLHFPDAEDPPPPRPFHAHPVRRSSPLAMTTTQNGSVGTSNGRRRVHSVNPGPSLPSHARGKRPVSTSLGASQTSSLREAMIDDSGIGLFSDEYDLYPRILQEVQRALKLKARREARLKSAASSPSSNKSEPVPSTSSPTKTSPLRATFPPISAPPPVPSIPEREPSTSGHSASRVGRHPVPSSLDEGTTLDWSGTGTEDERSERRWAMSITKRKDKDMKERHPSDSIVETRESMHAAKIMQIRTKISSSTLAKASAVGDQLRRRYKVIYNSLPMDDFNILKIARWFAGQDEVVKSSIDLAEPLTWLRHPGKVPQSQRNLSALIMEEFLIHLQGVPKSTDHQRLASLNSSPSLSVVSRPQFPSPQGSSYFNIGPSLTRKLSYEGRITFEPREARTSIDSRRSAESTYSSILSGSSLPVVVVPPSNTNTLHRRPPAPTLRATRCQNIPMTLDEGCGPLPYLPRTVIMFPGPATKANGRGVIPEKVSLSPIPDDRPSLFSSVEKLSVDLPPTATGRNFSQSKLRVSLPANEELRHQLERRRQQDADEEEASREYELKQQLLEATVAQNTRVRQLLHRVAAGVREYDEAQSSLSRSLTIPYEGIPRELVDAFSHDPAAVTGGTRSYKGWRAVDDIHNRLARQREIFQEFLSRAPRADHSPPPESGLANPIAALMQSLKTLESERQEIAWRATEVSHALTAVQSVHAEVKAAYNSTLSHTSVIYPEISTIVELEESYKDNYQYFWEVAMDVLTFILDTVAPFWRTYGKRVGTDVQDFLIIPLYRNEFTGEPKRYLIDTFPKRSLRHWVGLILFFAGTVALTVFQTQAAISSLWNFWLAGIPYTYVRRFLLIPFWISIIIQWWAVGVELSIVLTQLAVVVWWTGWYVNIFS
ncbi:hypothetical protein MSAN_02142800 [Mycena sanguinolenta]|uniref:Uncharacterized protein n=1 Tax=Mycena sanguinolenta TaxID=230812 RepID=A0A8H6XDV2_9AGAR|nr:hypothetical protein MSAN_02142800 [Mycena sanguinolenta]